MIITVSGPPGSGTTTASRALAPEFDMDHVSSGDVFRSLAKEHGVSLGEFNQIAEEDPEIDKEIDLRQKEIGEERDNIILEGRLSGWMVEDADLKVWLKAPFDERVRRVSDREDVNTETAREELRQREESEAKRYQEIHGIDISDLSVYDLVVDTSKWNAENVTEIIATAARRLDEED
ncbi:MAG: AAA family ATPase [Halobacteria archaeon]|nr:AAA family ATPase [Halobacteria archaeon]